MRFNDIKQILKDKKFYPKKSFGQNFLIDGNIKEKIINSVKIKEKSTILEIGSGFAAMSFLLSEQCKTLIAIEKDKRIFDIMLPFFEKVKNIKFFCEDFLNIDFKTITNNSKNLVVYGNIPYCISTPILVKLVENRGFLDRIYLVMQDDFVNRIISMPGSKIYGSISCFIQYYFDVKKLFKINKNCFSPAPKVESSFVEMQLIKKSKIKVKDETIMFKIIRKAFSQRRKKLINSLSCNCIFSIEKNQWCNILDKCNIDCFIRAEQLDLIDYAKISDVVFNEFLINKNKNIK